MTLEVDYVPFAIGAGANVYTPATYQALSVVGTGVEPGLADGQLANTTWRLASMTSAALANYISQQLGINVLDDGNLSNLIANLTSAISTGAGTTPSRIITSSSNILLLATDYAVMFNRTVGVAALNATLPTVTAAQKFKIGDLAGNFQPDPVTVVPPGGHNIAELPSVPLDVNRKTAEFQYHGSSTWSVMGVF